MLLKLLHGFKPNFAHQIMTTKYRSTPYFQSLSSSMWHKYNELDQKTILNLAEPLAENDLGYK